MAFLDETGLAELWSLIENKRNSLVNEYVWAKTTLVYTPQYTETVVSNRDIGTSQTAYYSDSFHVDGNMFVIDNPQTVTMTVSNAKTYLLGKYFILGAASKATMFKAETSATVSTATGNVRFNTITEYGSASVKTDVIVHGYVNSPNPSAYPVSDGYTYMSMGQFGSKAQVASGSYTGTGTYGTSTPNSLIFGFEPKMVAIVKSGNITMYSSGVFTIFVAPDAAFSAATSNNDYAAICSLSGSTFSWYNTKAAANQLNSSGTKYNYIAFG